MSKIEKKALDMGLVIPEAPKPVAAYVPGIKSGNLIFTSGQLPVVAGELKYKGKVGAGVTEEDGYEAAKICALNCLGVVKSITGNLDLIEQVVKVTGFVNSAPGFNGQPKVINGASELLRSLLGEAGLHARSAVGVNELPLDAACEVEMIIRVRS
ncbi:MAG: RidA family protein [Peptococcaceae bacterium]|jgi:enamine deaminase RidA (YjgF/YER057c/UK114 family)|nr:RidA family protein [Peptococcaceae bacterium]MDH7526187.1 RidA family protein [Peptococcaceae bacterium]